MASVNKAVKLRTHEGAPAAHISPKQQLERSVMACLLWESEFYESGVSIADRIAQLCAVVKPEDVADIARRAKHDMRLRHVPLLLARELFKRKESRQEAGKLLSEIIVRPDDMTEFLALYWAKGKAPLAKQAQKALARALPKFDAYQLAKYSGGQKAVKLRDVLRLCHAKPANDDEALLWKGLNEGTLATPDTWEVELSKGGDKKESWKRLLGENRLGGLAMLRNIRNMRQAGVDDDLIAAGIAKINAGRLLPINFISAAKHNPQFEPEIEAKFFQCFGKEKAKGKTILLIDVSGSMDCPLSGRSELMRLDVACSLGMIAREMFEDVSVMTFSNQVVVVPARRGFALRDAIVQSQTHWGTDLGGAVHHVASMPFDRLIVITDEQSHSSVPQIRGGYMINVASAKNGVGYGAWNHIDGWSDKVLNYILRMEESSALQVAA